MIRVLHVGMNSKLGGIEIFIMNLYRKINREKIQFDFIDATEDGIYFKDEIEKMGGKIYKVTPRRKGILKNRKEIEKIIADNNYKIIHNHLNTLSYITAIEIGLKRNLKVIVHSHNEWKGKKLKTLLLHKINFRKLYNKDIIRLACSDIAGKWIFGDNEYTVINNGIDTEKFKIDYEKRKRVRNEILNVKNEDTVVIGHVGAFREQKNHRYIIEIFKEYLKLNDNALLVFLGEGDTKQEIIDKVKKYGIEDKVKFLGIRNDTDCFYSAFDIFLFPSIFEGLGIVLIEAQLSGLKCFVSEAIPKEAIITDNVTQLCLKDMPNEWAMKMMTVDNTYDRNIEITEKIRKFDSSKLVKDLEEIYFNCIK